MNPGSEYISALWERTARTFKDACTARKYSPDVAANRAYYAAFYAVSSLLASEGKTYKKHSATRSAVHKELVNTGRWPAGLGDDFDNLLRLREVADYGVVKHVQPDDAELAIGCAWRIILAVHDANPDVFELPGGAEGELPLR